MTTTSFKDRLAKFNAFWEELETSEELSQVSDKALRKVVRFLPETLACPDITSTRIVYKDKTYSHGKIGKATREIVEPIKTFQSQIGQVEIHYSENGTKCSRTGLDDDGLILKLVTERLGVLSTFIEKDIENYGLLSVTKEGREFIKKPESFILTKDHDYESVDDDMDTINI